MYKLIAMDLDGTLNNDNKRIDTPTVEALLNAQRSGLRVLLASARPLPGLYRERDALELPAHRGLLMAYNGGVIVDAFSEKTLASAAMQAEQAQYVLRALEDLPVTPILDDGKIFYVKDKNGYMVEYECANNRMTCVEVSDLAGQLSFAPHKILMSVQPEDIMDVQARIAAILPEGLVVVRTAPFYLEVIPSRVNKGLGLRAACEAIGIDTAQAIAFGDSENDLEMLRVAGMGVAMGNAEPLVKDAADFVTLSNNENGIAAALEKLLG